MGKVREGKGVKEVKGIGIYHCISYSYSFWLMALFFWLGVWAVLWVKEKAGTITSAYWREEGLRMRESNGLWLWASCWIVEG